MIFRTIVTSLKLVSLLIFVLQSKVGTADDIPSAVRNTQNPKDVPPTPAVAVRRIKVPEGFNVSLFAGEPDVAQPIAMTTDALGRLWVAEFYSYPNWQPTGNDRIVIFEDTDGDGQCDKRKVFWDKGNYLSGLEVGLGGVWVCCAPHLLFIPDEDGEAYLKSRDGRVPLAHRRVLAELTACRTPALGVHQWSCDHCGEVFTAYNSCRNRHCVTCGGPGRARFDIVGDLSDRGMNSSLIHHYRCYGDGLLPDEVLFLEAYAYRGPDVVTGCDPQFAGPALEDGRIRQPPGPGLSGDHHGLAPRLAVVL